MASRDGNACSLAQPPRQRGLGQQRKRDADREAGNMGPPGHGAEGRADVGETAVAAGSRSRSAATPECARIPGTRPAAGPGPGVRAETAPDTCPRSPTPRRWSPRSAPWCRPRVTAPTRLASAPPSTNRTTNRRKPSTRSAGTPKMIRNSMFTVRCNQSAWMNSAVTRRAARSSASCCSHGALGSSRVAGTVPHCVKTRSRSGAGSVVSHRNAMTQAPTISRFAHAGRGLRRLGRCTNIAARSVSGRRADR